MQLKALSTKTQHYLSEVRSSTQPSTLRGSMRSDAVISHTVPIK